MSAYIIGLIEIHDRDEYNKYQAGGVGHRRQPTYRVDHTRRRLRFFFRDGRISLVAGVSFLVVCIALIQLRPDDGARVDRRNCR